MVKTLGAEPMQLITKIINTKTNGLVAPKIVIHYDAQIVDLFQKANKKIGSKPLFIFEVLFQKPYRKLIMASIILKRKWCFLPKLQ
jgi:hypothetical protein